MLKVFIFLIFSYPRCIRLKVIHISILYIPSRMMFTCPSCRAAAQVPHEGVVGLPINKVLAKGAQLMRQRRQCGDTPVCFTCQTAVGVSECGHCGRMWCDICGASHALSVRDAVIELQERLVAARETLYYRAEEDEASEASLR